MQEPTALTPRKEARLVRALFVLALLRAGLLGRPFFRAALVRLLFVLPCLCIPLIPLLLRLPHGLAVTLDLGFGGGLLGGGFFGMVLLILALLGLGSGFLGSLLLLSLDATMLRTAAHAGCPGGGAPCLLEFVLTFAS